MYILIKHLASNESKIVDELNDLLFEDGWRFVRYVTNAKVSLFTIDELKHNTINLTNEGWELSGKRGRD